MRLLGKKVALERLTEVKARLKAEIATYESRAKNCARCDTPGACCLDAHFVNVHVSRLEAEAIMSALAGMPTDLQSRVSERVNAAIETYGLTATGDTWAQKFACPLFEKGIGCLVHSTAKPVPCMVHACYEREADLPPDELQTAAEEQIDALNTRAYGRPQQWLPLPLAIRPVSTDDGAG